jgi:hypothetical protein
VCAGVVEIFALEPDLGAAEVLGKPLRVIHRTRATDIVFEFVFELSEKILVLAQSLVVIAQFLQCMDQGLGDKHAAISAKVAMLVREVVGP